MFKTLERPNMTNTLSAEELNPWLEDEKCQKAYLLGLADGAARAHGENKIMSDQQDAVIQGLVEGIDYALEAPEHDSDCEWNTNLSICTCWIDLLKESRSKLPPDWLEQHRKREAVIEAAKELVLTSRKPMPEHVGDYEADLLGLEEAVIKLEALERGEG